MQGDTARAHVYSGSRTCPHRWYFQGYSLLLLSYPRGHSYTFSCPVGDTQPVSSKKLSPSKPFHLPTVSSLSPHSNLHFSVFCPLKGPSSQIDCGSQGGLAASVLHSALSSSVVPQVPICCLVFVFTLEKIFLNVTGAATT